jgi:hypothetical protein
LAVISIQGQPIDPAYHYQLAVERKTRVYVSNPGNKTPWNRNTQLVMDEDRLSDIL